MAKYVCRDCGAAAMLIRGEVVRKCDCEAPVVADMQSTLEGRGGVV